MVLGQISEDGDVPLDPTGALLGERVGRDFHGRTPASGVRDLGKQFLKVERFGGSARGGQDALADFVTNGPEQAAAHSGFLANMLD